MKPVADPLAWAWLALLIASGVEFIARRRKAACILLGVALAASLIQMADIPGWLLANLERPYLPDPRRPLPTADAVVVLGGYLHAFSASYTGIECQPELDRLFTGIALVRSGKGPVLVLGGRARITCIPNTGSLLTLRYWLEEVLGNLYYRLRGWA